MVWCAGASNMPASLALGAFRKFEAHSRHSRLDGPDLRLVEPFQISNALARVLVNPFDFQREFVFERRGLKRKPRFLCQSAPCCDVRYGSQRKRGSKHLEELCSNNPQSKSIVTACAKEISRCIRL